MKKVFLTSVASLILAGTLSTPASALTVGGVDLPDTYAADNTELQLNGAGTRSKFFIDLYVGSLYVEQAQQNASAVIEADAPQAITLHITSGMITSERMTDATMEGFEAATDGNLAPLQTEIDQFMAVFEEEIKDGDVFDLVYVPGKGVNVLKNGDEKGTVAGLEFKKALFGIWLGEEPAQKSLKEKMLSGS